MPLRTEDEIRAALRATENLLQGLTANARKTDRALTEDEEDVADNLMQILDDLEWVLGESRSEKTLVANMVSLWKQFESIQISYEAGLLERLAKIGIQILPTGGVQ